MSPLSFNIGLFTLALSVCSLLLYLAYYGLRRVAAWFVRGEPPKDRVLAFSLLIGVVFFVLGGLLQGQWDGLQACRAQGSSMGECFTKIQ